jgi:hypothetical protein
MEAIMQYQNSLYLPELYDFQTYIDTARQIIALQRRVSAEAALKVGKILTEIKANEGHGNWISTLYELGMNRKEAERLMKIAEMFGDDAEKLEGLGKTKAAILAYMPEENLIRLKEDDILIGQDGEAYTWGQIKEMTTRDMERNFKKEIKELRDKDRNHVSEKEMMEKENKRKDDLNEQLMKDANAAMLAQIKAKDKMLAGKDERINELLELTMEQQEAKKTGEAAFEAIIDYRGNIIQAVGKLNTVKLVRDVKLRAEYYGAIIWARELLKSLEERAGAYFGPLIDIDPKDLKEAEEFAGKTE